MFRWDATGALADTRVPLRLLAGSVDIVTKAEASAELSVQSGGMLHVIEGCNHMGFLERHDVYNAEIAAFARQADGNPVSPPVIPFPRPSEPGGPTASAASG